MIRHLTAVVIAVATLAAAPAGQTQTGGGGPEGTFQYRVVHPTHGDIGTYTNVVRRQGNGVSVDTTVDIEVKIAFVTAHDLEADRSERWEDGRLVRYESTTEKNGDTVRIEGRAEGDKFVINGADGQIVAPASVMPTNAWSDRILEADVVMASETGALYDATVSGGTRETVEVKGEQIPARRFRMQADATYEVWLDDRNRVVRFTTTEDGDRIVFELV